MDAVGFLSREVESGYCFEDDDEGPMKFHLDPQWDTDDPQGRLFHVTKVRLIWKSITPILTDPGTSFCNRCKGLTIDKLCSAEGYIHSYCYWALLASAEVSKCPMCLLLVNTLRGTRDDSFDLAISLLNPYRKDLQVRVRAVPKERRLERENLEVEVMNMPFMRPVRASMVMVSGIVLFFNTLAVAELRTDWVNQVPKPPSMDLCSSSY